MIQNGGPRFITAQLLHVTLHYHNVFKAPTLIYKPSSQNMAGKEKCNIFWLKSNVSNDGTRINLNYLSAGPWWSFSVSRTQSTPPARHAQTPCCSKRALHPTDSPKHITCCRLILIFELCERWINALWHHAVIKGTAETVNAVTVRHSKGLPGSEQCCLCHIHVINPIYLAV